MSEQIINYKQIPNGYYSIHFSEDQTYCLNTINEYSKNDDQDHQIISIEKQIHFEPFENKSNQIYYILFDETTESHFIIPIMTNECIGCEYVECEEDTVIIQNKISFESNWRWKFIEINKNDENENVYQLEIQSNKMKIGFNKMYGDYMNSHLTLNSSEEHITTFTLTQREQTDKNILEWENYMNQVRYIHDIPEFEFPSTTETITKVIVSLFKYLKRIVIPSSIEHIEENAFDHLVIEEITCLPTVLEHFKKHSKTLKLIKMNDETTEMTITQFDAFRGIKQLIIPMNVKKLKISSHNTSLID